MIKPKEELLSILKTKLDGDTSDEALAIIEDVTDTIADFESKATDSTDWKTKYEENDKAWREKYKERFFNSSTDDNDDNDDNNNNNKPMTFDQLFTRG